MRLIEKAKALFRRPRQHTPTEMLAKYELKGYDENGKFIPDSTPMAPPIGYQPQASMVEIVRDMVRSEKLAQDLAAAGHETFAESEDFDIEDEPGAPPSQWENEYDPPLEELLSAGEQSLAEKKAKEEAPPPAASEGSKPKKRSGAKPKASAEAPADPDEESAE